MTLPVTWCCCSAGPLTEPLREMPCPEPPVVFRGEPGYAQLGYCPVHAPWLEGLEQHRAVTAAYWAAVDDRVRAEAVARRQVAA